MDIAIVTGAETPLGLRIIEDLIRQGCRVHGIGNNFSQVKFADPHFIAHAIDLSDLETVARTTTEILEKEQRLHILIHAIDVTPGAPFEKLPLGNLEAILKVGLLGPVMLTRLALPNLLRFRGQLINIIPANKSGHIASAVNALIEGGLREMNTALFDQARDAGLRVTNLILRQNTVTDLDAGIEKQQQARIDPEHVARTIERLLDENDPNVPNEITLYPRLSANAETALPETALPIDPYNAVVLPPAEYCPPKQEAIPTQPKEQIERTIPYSDEEMEEKIASAIEEFEAHPERHENERPARREKSKKRRDQKPERNKQRPESEKSDVSRRSEGEQQSDQQNSDQSDQKRRRGRRRGGRNRNRDQQTRGHQESNSTGNVSSPENQSSPQRGEAKPDGPKKPAHNRNKNRRPDQTVNEKDQPKPHDSKQDKAKEASEKPKAAPADEVKQKAKPKPKPVAKKESNSPSEAKPKTAKKKTATKKAVKKAVKKAAVKKVATKKSVKKTATKKATKKAVKKKVAKKAE